MDTELLATEKRTIGKRGDCMGMFLQTAIITDCKTDKAQRIIETLAGGKNPYELIPSACQVRRQQEDCIVYFNSSCAGYEFLAEDLSAEAETAVLLLYLYDGDYWGYYFFCKGERLDCFSPIPDYFDGHLSDEELKQFAGNAKLLTQWFKVEEAQISRYLVNWNTREGEFAYPEDEYPYGDCWQMADFLQKLGYSYDPDEDSDPQTEPTTPDEKTNHLPHSAEELFALEAPSPDKPVGDDGIFATGRLPNALDGAYIRTLLQEDTYEIFTQLCIDPSDMTMQLLKEKFDPNRSDPILSTLYAFYQYWFGNPDMAYWCLYNALDADPDNIMLLRARSLVVATSSKTHLHIKDLTNLLRLDPANADVYLLSLAFFHLLNGKHLTIKKDDAYRDLEQLAKNGFPAIDDPRIIYTAFSDEFMDMLAEVKNQRAGTAIAKRRIEIDERIPFGEIALLQDGTFDNIFELLENGRFKDAVVACTKEIAQDPENDKLYFLRAYSYQNDRSWMSTPKKLMDDLHTLLQYQPNHVPALRAIGLMYVSQIPDKCKQQIAILTKLIELDPDYGDVYLHHRSYAYYEIKEYEQALLDLEAFAEWGKAQTTSALLSFDLMKKDIDGQALYQMMRRNDLHLLEELPTH